MAAAASGVEPLADADFDAWLPKIGVSYHATEDVTASLIYQKGYRSGGVGTNIARQEVYTYDAEYTDNYELSVRSVWQNGKLMWNTNIFYMDWTDQQVTLSLSDASFDTVTENAGESTVKGFETEVFYYPSSQLTLTGGLGLAKTEFDEYPSKPHLVGRSFEDSPEWTANIAASYDFGNGFSAGINANYRDDSHAYIDPEASLEPQKLAIDSDPKNDSHVLVNANASYQWDNYTVRIDASNLLDEEYINQYFSEADNLGEADSYGQHQIGRARQISVSLLAEF